MGHAVAASIEMSEKDTLFTHHTHPLQDEILHDY